MIHGTVSAVSKAHDAPPFDQNLLAATMTSIITNHGAMAALATLRSISGNLDKTQAQISSGLRVGTATDNAAYWSISTAMRSDKMGHSAVLDALAISAAKTDTAYAAMNAVGDVLVNIRSKLVAALEPGIDKAKVQKEISQLAQSTKDIANSASFAGVNWLSTNIHDLYEAEPNMRSSTMLASYARTSSGNVSLNTISVDHINTSLFNGVEGGGILDGDPRSPKTIGGAREAFFDEHNIRQWVPNHDFGTSPPKQVFDFAGPITFSSAADQISFDIVIDKDNPTDGISAPYHPGVTTPSITITKADVDARYPAAGGTISDYHMMIEVLSLALAGSGVTARYVTKTENNVSVIVPDKYALFYSSSSGLDGSYMELSNLTSTVGLGGLGEFDVFGVRDNSLSLTFEPFKIFKDVEIAFDFSVNSEPASTHVINRTVVNDVLGTTDGWINTADDMVTLLQSLITRPDTIIEKTSDTSISIISDPLVDRLSGGKTRIGFSNISVNVEPLPETGILAMNVEEKPTMIHVYLQEIDAMITRVHDGAAVIGALQLRVSMQHDSVRNLMDTFEKGIGRLTDADMNEASTRLKALQTQQQLSIQALHIANSAPEAIMQLLQ